MRSPRALVILWGIIGIVIWWAVFDWSMHVSSREYVLRAAQAELGLVPEPSMTELMAAARRTGAWRATVWAGGIVGAGLFTLRQARRAATSEE